MSYLIRHCELEEPGTALDIRIADGHIAEIGQHLTDDGSEIVIHANGGRLLPGLHDHHIHLLSLAASMDSLVCGQPGPASREALQHRLAEENDNAGQGWLRCINYHPSIAGDIDRHWLDQFLPDRPARVQHRGGRLWVLNTAALTAIGIAPTQDTVELPVGVEHDGTSYSGRLYDCDTWLRTRLPASPPSIRRASRLLASYGITGVTDTTPSNDLDMRRHFESAQTNGELLQRLRMMGELDIPSVSDSTHLQLGEYKVHLLESQLPEIDDLIDAMRQAHARQRSVAIHCVTRTELVFALTCLERAGAAQGDRIEHASIVPADQLNKMVELGVRVVTQPHFVTERGDHYLQDVEEQDRALLYRLKSLADAGIPLAAGSDAPFGDADPWRAMAAAVARKTRAGTALQPGERLTPEQALGLFTSTPEAPGVTPRALNVGAPADLCLLDSPWREARAQLSSERVAATWCAGVLIYQAE